MDEDLKNKITARYFGEYYQKLRDEDNSFSGKLEKFTSRNETPLWGGAGIGISGLVAAAYIFPAIVLAPAVIVPSVIFSVAVISGWPAVCSAARDKNARIADEKIQEDMDNGVLVERYKAEVLKKDPQHSQDLKKLETAEASAQFKANRLKEKAETEDADAADAAVARRLEMLKKNRPKSGLKK